MLKEVPAILSPELMFLLMSMGHGDELVIADGNFPADSHAERIVRADGLSATTIVEAVLQFLPIDTFVDDPAVVMQPVDPDAPEPVIWEEFRRLLEAGEGRAIPLTSIERYEFYDRAKDAYGIVATGETALYANLILKKGVVGP